MASKFIHVATHDKITVFLRPSNIPLYTHTVFSLSSPPLCPIYGHIGSFHVLTHMNNAAVSNNAGVQLSFDILISCLRGTSPEVGLLGYMVVLFLVFKEHLQFSMMACTNLHSNQLRARVLCLHVLTITFLFLVEAFPPVQTNLSTPVFYIVCCLTASGVESTILNLFSILKFLFSRKLQILSSENLLYIDFIYTLGE